MRPQVMGFKLVLPLLPAMHDTSQQGKQAPWAMSRYERRGPQQHVRAAVPCPSPHASSLALCFFYLQLRSLLGSLLQGLDQWAGVPKGRGLLAVGKKGEVLPIGITSSAHLADLQHLSRRHGSGVKKLARRITLEDRCELQSSTGLLTLAYICWVGHFHGRTTPRL